MPIGKLSASLGNVNAGHGSEQRDLPVKSTTFGIILTALKGDAISDATLKNELLLSASAATAKWNFDRYGESRPRIGGFGTLGLKTVNQIGSVPNKADAALYQVKNHRRNGYCCYQDDELKPVMIQLRH